MPTLLDLCDGHPLMDSAASEVHGVSLGPVLRGHDSALLETRAIVTDSQRVELPIKWRQSCVVSRAWRLVNGIELYNIEDDPAQSFNLAPTYPNVVETLRGAYEDWWLLVSGKFDEEIPIVIGSTHEPETMLCTSDWHGTGWAWHQGLVREGHECNGHFAVEVAEAGRYEFELRRWPREQDTAIGDGIPGEITWYTGGRAIEAGTARLRIGTQMKEIAIAPSDRCAVLRFDLPSGCASIQSWFDPMPHRADIPETPRESPSDLGAYYIYVRRTARAT
jgi:hypothetical protein